MNMNFKKIGLVAAVASTPLLMVNANANPVTADAAAEIIAAITLSQTNGLDFGSIVADTTGGTVTMSTTGVRDCGTLVCAVQDTGTAATFAVTGQANYTYAITLPTAAFAIDDGGATNTMDVTVTGPATGTLDGTGADTFNVGGSLAVGASQAAGAYAGTFQVSVAYN